MMGLVTATSILPNTYRIVLTFVWAILCLISGALNFVTGGSFFEPFSARVGRNSYCHASPHFFWRSLHLAIDSLFFLDPNHCVSAFFRAAQRRTKQLKWRILWLWRTF